MLPPWLLDSLKKMFIAQQLHGGVADEVHRVDRQQRLVVHDGSDERVPRDVAGREDRDHPGQGQGLRRVDALQATVRHRRADHVRHDAARREGEVVDVFRVTRDVEMARLVLHGFSSQKRSKRLRASCPRYQAEPR